MPSFAHAQAAEDQTLSLDRAQPPPATRDRGWVGRELPNIGLLVTRTSPRDGASDATAIGFEASYMWLLHALVEPGEPRVPTPFERGWRGMVRRLSVLGAGVFTQLEFTNFEAGERAAPRVAIGGMGGGFVGVEAGVFYRAPGDNYAGTFGVQIAPYLSLGAFSFAVRLPVWSTRADSGSGPIFNEGFALAVKIAPLHLLALIFDWQNFLNPEYRP